MSPRARTRTASGSPPRSARTSATTPPASPSASSTLRPRFNRHGRLPPGTSRRAISLPAPSCHRPPPVTQLTGSFEAVPPPDPARLDDGPRLGEGFERLQRGLQDRPLLPDREGLAHGVAEGGG